MSQVLGVIPARGGSKGVPRKNARLLGGVPLIAHTIIAAKQAEKLDRIVVTTEDEELALIAGEYGADVMRRPLELASDDVQNFAVVDHVLKNLNEDISHIVLLQPTSPLRSSTDIDRCVSICKQDGILSVFSVTACEYHPSKTVLMEGDDVLLFHDLKSMEARRQELPEAFRQNGAIYVVRKDAFIEGGGFIRPPCRVHVMPHETSVDIDTEADFAIAEQRLIEKHVYEREDWKRG